MLEELIVCVIIDGKLHPVIVKEEDRKTVEFIVKTALADDDGVVHCIKEHVGELLVNNTPYMGHRTEEDK